MRDLLNEFDQIVRMLHENRIRNAVVRPGSDHDICLLRRRIRIFRAWKKVLGAIMGPIICL